MLGSVKANATVYLQEKIYNLSILALSTIGMWAQYCSFIGVVTKLTTHSCSNIFYYDCISLVEQLCNKSSSLINIIICSYNMFCSVLPTKSALCV